MSTGMAIRTTTMPRIPGELSRFDEIKKNNTEGDNVHPAKVNGKAHAARYGDCML